MDENIDLQATEAAAREASARMDAEGVPKLFDPNRHKEARDLALGYDRELDVLHGLISAIESLEPMARPRVMHYLNDRYAAEGF